MNNAEYAMMLMEDTGIRKADHLNLVAQQVGDKLTKELNEELDFIEMTRREIYDSVSVGRIQDRIHEEIKKLLNTDSLDGYMISGRIDHVILSMEYDVVVHIKEKWIFKRRLEENVRFEQVVQGEWVRP